MHLTVTVWRPLGHFRELAKPRLQGLVELAERYPILDVRSRGLICAAELGSRGGAASAEPGIAAAVTKAAGRRNLLLCTAGETMHPRDPNF